MKIPVKLQWSSAFSFEDVLLDKEEVQPYKCRGLYAWVEFSNIRKQPHLTYLGWSENIVNRQFTHFCKTLSCEYVVLEYLEDDKPKVYWMPNTKDHYKNLLDKDFYLELVSKAHNSNTTSNIFFCSMENVPKEDVKAIERSLVFENKPITNNRGTKSPPVYRYNVEHCGSKLLTDLFKN